MSSTDLFGKVSILFIANREFRNLYVGHVFIQRIMEKAGILTQASPSLIGDVLLLLSITAVVVAVLALEPITRAYQKVMDFLNEVLFRTMKNSKEKRKSRLKRLFLRFADSYEQNRCFPMVVMAGRDQIHLLVAVSGLK